MITVKARAVDGPDKPFRVAEIKRRDLDLHDVLIEIKYAGICHSDIHTAHGEWGARELSSCTGTRDCRNCHRCWSRGNKV